MRYTTKKIGKAGQRSTFGLLASGAATVNFRQRMTISRKAVASGSIASDWKNVGCDLGRAIAKVKGGLERA